MKDIAIFGVGGFGREVLTLIQDINKVEPIWNVIGFFDDGKEIGAQCHGYKVLGGSKELREWKSDLSVVIAMVGCTILGVTIERIAYKPLRNAGSSLAVLITAIGVSYLLQNLAL